MLKLNVGKLRCIIDGIRIVFTMSTFHDTFTISIIGAAAVMGITFLVAHIHNYYSAAKKHKIKVDLPDEKTSIQNMMSRSVIPHQAGSISIYFGCMFSGKTEEIITKVYRRAYAQRAGVIIKYALDNRYAEGNELATHSEIRLKSTVGSKNCAPVRIQSAHLLKNVVIDEKETTIGIDEGQFYSDLVEMCTVWMNQGKHIYIAALDGDFKKQPFGDVWQLIPLASHVCKLTAICQCGRKGIYTRRTQSHDSQVMIGGKELYQASCANCWRLPDDHQSPE